ncbi:MAG: hypothetical protein ACTHZ6_16155 [Brevibacterium aurantiacum]|uniref:hypothetical protein n=1 Tax=Brevibacterium aurantiacum TaxID=273384 RepID=UPI003F8FFAE8
MGDYTPNYGSAREMYAYGADSFHGTVSRPENRAEFDRFINKVRAEAWDEGLQAGWEECQNPDPFVNDWWDSKAPNPHRIESGASNE